MSEPVPMHAVSLQTAFLVAKVLSDLRTLPAGEIADAFGDLEAAFSNRSVGDAQAALSKLYDLLVQTANQPALVADVKALAASFGLAF